jgi:hypothetical protein
VIRGLRTLLRCHRLVSFGVIQPIVKPLQCGLTMIDLRPYRRQNAAWVVSRWSTPTLAASNQDQNAKLTSCVSAEVSRSPYHSAILCICGTSAVAVRRKHKVQQIFQVLTGGGDQCQMDRRPISQR